MAETGRVAQMHIEWCRICGAINLNQVEGDPEPCGDPERHFEWHRERGDIPAPETPATEEN